MRTLTHLAIGLALITAPAFAGKNYEFDVSSAKVAGGTIEINALSKVEALADGNIVSESTFFFPAAPEKIVAQLNDPAGLCKLASFCAGVEKVGATEDGQGWVGEMTIDATKISKVAGRNAEWVRDLKSATEPHGNYKLRFEVRSTKAGNDTVLSFLLLQGRVFTKLDVTVRVSAGGPAATLVAVRSLSNSKLGATVGDRLSIAKRLIRDSAAMLDHAVNNAN